MGQTDTPRERVADNIVHVLGLAASAVAVSVMVVGAALFLPALSTLSLTIYGAAMLAMFGFSAIYHMTPASRWTGLLRRLDHAAIFLKIAGTYTPFALVKIGGTTGGALLASVWSVAILGAAGKLLLATTWDRVAIPLYLALGWAGIVMLPSLAHSVDSVVLLLLGLGGALYSIGVIFHVWRSLPFQNAVWHLFVLAGTACHFGAVTTAVFA
jgi:hemolysin III